MEFGASIRTCGAAVFMGIFSCDCLRFIIIIILLPASSGELSFFGIFGILLRTPLP